MEMMMKISKCKKELARIISENGGWREGAGYLAMDTSGMVCGYLSTPKWSSSLREWTGSACFRIFISTTLAPNHQRTILSRAEYFHLYPATDAKPEFCESVMRSIPEPIAKPTIEQLAADYRNAKDYAERKQQEAGDAKADADARLKALEIACKAIGLVVSPIAAKQEPELVTTEWRDLRVGDEIDVFNFERPGNESSRKQELMSGPCVVMQAEGGNVRIELKKNLPTKGSHWNATGVDACEFKFIRRP